MYKKYVSTFVLASLAILLSSCATAEPTEFGVPQSQFDQMTNAQQQQVIHDYNKKKETEEILGVVGAVAGATLPHDKTDVLSDKKTTHSETKTTFTY